jgi:hypothetical protein
MTTYHVCGEHSLLYKQDGMRNYGVLASKPQLGGYDPMSGTCTPDESKLRPATTKDFDHFRVCWNGHIGGEA